ncbi:hypothetical protein FQ087_00905 [Sporosarcina sp. ANT_H38]|uniref:hypothetical protein n=1 Tax=Sporosarcina sp. ANT_H38 TaxID=2597358 RepID=UPI0011F3A055|nr:hypothetical protein [Sporosarcina sp. ANT_H38]KAA0964922.1 hypothetical protein FQ087_00905 [Sporosarcina sp. ANT_H38]
MKFFLKLNTVSAIYAFSLFISIELQVNFYRIWRLTGWQVNTIEIVIGAIHFVGFFLTLFLFYFFISNWLEGRKASYWTVILWFPYLILFIAIFAILFPITYPGDKPAPVSGLIIIAQLISYPIYLFFINFIGRELGTGIDEKRT